MKQLNFFQTNLNQIDNIFQDSKFIINTKGNCNVDNKSSYVFLNNIYEFIKNDKTEILLTHIKYLVQENTYFNIEEFIKEEKNNIIEFFVINKNDLCNEMPKIILRFIFNNNVEKVLKTNFATFKKLYEELEENLLSLNSTYARRIDSFTK